MASPHDALFKYVFRQPEHAASELRAILPSALSKRFDWRTLQLEPASFVDEQLRGRHADLLFSVRCEGLPAYVYVLFEHQSTSDPQSVLYRKANGQASKLSFGAQVLMENRHGLCAGITVHNPIAQDEPTVALA